MPKIIHIVLGKANPDRLNGVNKVVYALACERIANKQPVEVWGLTSDANGNTSRPFPMRFFSIKRFNWRLPAELYQAIQSASPDTLFHLHGGLIPVYAILSRVLQRENRPYIVTLHGNMLQKSLLRGFWYKYPYSALIERRMLNRASVIHAITSQEKNELRWLRLRTRMVVIPNGAVLEPQTTPIAPIGHHTMRFLYMGRFASAHKGLDILIKSFAVFYQATQHGHLFLIGDGPDKRRINQLIKHYHIQHRVKVLPPQFQSEKAHSLAEADVFIHTSRWDVLPTGCLEAAAAGKPLLVTAQTGFAPLINKHQAGWVTHHPAVSEISQAMLSAYHAWRNNHLPTMGAKARSMIDSELNWPAIAKRFDNEIYNHVIT